MTPEQRRRRDEEERRRRQSSQRGYTPGYTPVDDSPYQPVNECPRVTDNGIQDSSSDSSSASCD